ncbi:MULTISPECIES: DUF305 domain-containing protein [unclassified Acinetobacter]|uniref:CopM family metallochaperone n=1 Tax=unclassified Acinetobacter TaxID=196816 RepID=UPI0035B88214
MRKIYYVTLAISIAVLSACGKTEQAPTSASVSSSNNIPSSTPEVIGKKDPATLPEHSQQYQSILQKMDMDMTMAMQNPDPDISFAQGMIPHHQGALDMAKVQLKYGKDPEMRQLAQNIINNQQKEIDALNQWLSTQKITPTEHPSHDMSHDTPMDEIDGIDHTNPDIAFANGMVAHHSMALDMADIEIKEGKNAAMTSLAQHVIDSQTQEITTLQAWLDKQPQ